MTRLLTAGKEEISRQGSTFQFIMHHQKMRSVFLSVFCFIEFIAKCLSATCPTTNHLFTFLDEHSLYFSTSPRDATFLNTRTTKIHCKAGGLPKPSVSWETINGEAVGNVSGIRVVNYDGSLEFPAFKAKRFNPAVHRMQYRCIAKSSLGRLYSAAIKINASM